jgi:hypothetical protein
MSQRAHSKVPPITHVTPEHCNAIDNLCKRSGDKLSVRLLCYHLASMAPSESGSRSKGTRVGFWEVGGVDGLADADSYGAQSDVYHVTDLAALSQDSKAVLARDVMEHIKSARSQAVRIGSVPSLAEIAASQADGQFEYDLGEWRIMSWRHEVVCTATIIPH